MQAVHGIGNAPPSKEFLFKTIAAPPSLKPKHVVAMATGPQQIVVEWEDIPMQYWNGQLLAFYII